MRFFQKIPVALNIILAVAFVASAFSGWINPNLFGWAVSLSLVFPLLLVANIVAMIVWLICLSRHWLWSFAAMVVCFFQIRTYCPVNIGQPVPKGSIKVVSYNLYGYGKTSPDSLAFENMLRYLSQSDADIFCAQEAYYNPQDKKRVEEALSHWPYRDSVFVEGTWNALMLCSNFPIIDRHVIESSSPGHPSVLYRLKIEHDTVVVANCHFVSNSISVEDKRAYLGILTVADTINAQDNVLRLGHKVNNAGCRRADQADSLVEHLAQYAGMPIIVCGDFNDSPLSYAHQILTRCLNDAYTASGNGIGISYNSAAMFFRLDNILCSPHWRSFGAKVDMAQKMSDHYPIETWLKRNLSGD